MDRAEEEDDQQVIFPAGVVDGDKRTLGNLIRSNQKNELEAEMTKHRVDLRNGLLDPDKLYRYAVTCRPGKVTEVPHREKQPDGEMKTTSWTTVQVLAPVYLEPLGMGADALIQLFEKQLTANAQEAGKALDAMTQKFTAYQQTGVAVS
jgi:hypothetical protein